VEQVMHESLGTQAILQRMEEVRCDLDEDVQEIVEGARVMGKWRYYVRTYPWICLGAALAGGYLIVPRVWRRQPNDQTPVELPNPSRLPVTSNSPHTGSARGALLAFVGNLVLRGVSSYALQQAGKLFAVQAATRPQNNQP
jgi:hypothetical protein